MEGYRIMYLAYLAAVLADCQQAHVSRADEAVREATARCAPQADIMRLLTVRKHGCKVREVHNTVPLHFADYREL